MQSSVRDFKTWTNFGYDLLASLTCLWSSTIGDRGMNAGKRVSIAYIWTTETLATNFNKHSSDKVAKKSTLGMATYNHVYTTLW